MKKTIIAALLFGATFSVSSQVNTDRVMMIGRNALYFEDYVVAIQYFNQVIVAKPYLADPYYFRAMAKFMLDDFKGAEEDATECLDRNPYYTAAYQLRGASRQNQEKYEMAAVDYQRSLEFFPDDKLTLINMAIVNIELKNFDIAEKFFEALLRRNPDYTQGYLARARLNIERKDSLRALADYDKSIKINPYEPQSFSARGLLYFQLKDYNKALADLDESIRLDPYFTGNYINRGLVKYNLNDLRGAMADYDRVIEIEENNLIARFNRGLLRRQVGDDNRAIADFDKVIELDPDNSIAYFNRAMLKNEVGDRRGAIADLDVVLKEHPDFFSGYYLRSEMKRQLNLLRDAEQDYMLARREEAKAKSRATTNPEESGTTSSKKKSENTREQTDEDIEKFNLLVVADKTSTDKSKSKYQRESRGRVQDLNIAIEAEPKFSITYYDKGFDVPRPVYFSEIIERANKDLNLKWKLKVVNNEAPLNEAQVRAHFRSIDNYSKQIAQKEDNAALRFGRSLDFMLVQDYENSLKDINEAISLNSGFMMAYFARAVIQTKQMQLEPVEIPEEKTKEETRSENTQILNVGKLPSAKLPEISTKSFRHDAILRDYETVLRLEPDFFYAHYNMGEIFRMEKDYRAAIDSYNKAIKIEPQFAEAFFNRGLAKLSIGESASGLDDLRKAGELGVVESYSIIKRMQ